MKEVAERLKLKSTDAAVRWCHKKDIDMIKPINKWMVPEMALTLAFDEEMINQLKKKYGSRWSDFYDAYKNNDLKRLDELIIGRHEMKSKTNGQILFELIRRINYERSYNK